MQIKSTTLRGIAGLIIAVVLISTVCLLAIGRLAPQTLAVSQWTAAVTILISGIAFSVWILRTYKD